MKKAYYLGIDAGTTKLKLALYDEALREVGSVSRGTRVYAPEDGASEMDMEELWDALCQASRELCAAHPGEMAALRCLGISGQGDGLWPLDRRGRPACRAILWNDARSRRMNIDGIPGFQDLLRAECMNMVYTGSMPAIQKWLKAERTEVYASIGTSLHCKDWLNYRLTGRVVSDSSDLVCSSGMNALTLRYVPELFESLDIPEMLPTMPQAAASLDVIGKVNAEAAERTGIPRGTAVIAGCIDCCASAAGNDFFREGEGCSIIGTSMINEICLDRRQVDPRDLRGLLLCHVVPGRYIKMMGTAGGASCVDYVREMVAPSEDFDALFREIGRIPIGSNGLIYHPYLYGERAPFKAPDASGAFLGLRSYHTRYHLLRAAYEGIAMMLVDCFRAMNPVSAVCLSGGAARSELVCQMLCDALGVPAKRQRVAEPGTLGIVKMCRIAMGDAEDFDQQAQADYRRFTPDPANHQRYEALYGSFVATRDSLMPYWGSFQR